jgi:hypothetical protein
MASPKKNSVDPVAWKNRLMEACSAYRTPPTFKEGDLLTHHPALYPPGEIEEAFQHGVVPVLIVVETHPSWRKLCVGDDISDEMPADSQAVLIGQFDIDGMFSTSWASSHSFILAPPELLSPRDGTANLNH